jgi:hypothetical protein
VEIGDVVSCTCMTLMLLHLLYSHVITAYRMQRVLHEGSNYMSLYYSLSAEEKTWEPRFEPLLDPSQWPLYRRLNYVLVVAKRKMWKGRQNKKRFCNEMGDMEKVTTMICTVPLTSTRLRIKYIVPSVMVNTTPWIDTRKGQRGTKDHVVP